MKTTVKFQRPGQQPKFIPNCKNFKGYLVQEIEVGVGTPVVKGGFNSYGEGEVWEEYSKYETRLKPFVDADMISASEKEEIKRILEKTNTIQAVIDAGFEHALIKFETNDRYSVIDTAEEAEQKQVAEEKAIEEKTAPVVFVNEHYFGLRLISRIPKNLFSKIAKFGEYINAEQIDDWFDDMDDFHKVGSGKYLKGWYFEKGAIDTLQSNGYLVEIK